MDTPDTLCISPALTQSQFVRISRIVYEHCGINLTEGKEGLVRGRLVKRLRKLNIPGFEQYIRFLEEAGGEKEMLAMVDALTTNKTSFFREPRHFEFFKTRIVPSLQSEGNRIRIWSAGCSSGEEPYSVAILLRECIPDIDRRDCKILATDICSRILEAAQRGIYGQESMADIPAQYRERYFVASGTRNERTYRVNDSLHDMVRFARLNLMHEWPMRGPFDLVLCRNVMIYFDKPTQAALVKRFWNLLKKGGYLFVGHSESLTSSTQEFRYVQPATYIK